MGEVISEPYTLHNAKHKSMSILLYLAHMPCYWVRNSATDIARAGLQTRTKKTFQEGFRTHNIGNT